jgi:hypothetical protein
MTALQSSKSEQFSHRPEQEAEFGLRCIGVLEPDLDERVPVVFALDGPQVGECPQSCSPGW